MKGNYEKLDTVVRTALEECCTDHSISFQESDTNADLCTKINNDH